MDDLSQFKNIFFAECEELLADLEDQLSLLRGGEADSECLNAIFRAVHSIKAGAGAFQFMELVSFSHIFEAVLDALRDDRVEVTETLTDLLFQSNDILSELVEAARNDEPVADGFGAEAAAALRAVVGGEAGDDGAAPDPGATAGDETPEPVDTASGERRFHIVFKPAPNMLLSANEPVFLLNELAALGALERRVHVEDLPAFPEINPEQAYFHWTLELTTASDREAVEEVFEFVAHDCELLIEEITPAASAAEAEDEEQAFGLFTEADENEDAFGLFPEAEAQPDLAAAPDTKADTPPAAAPARAPQAKTGGNAKPDAAGKSARISSIRVDLDRVDRLVNMVGELVITQSMLSQQAETLPGDTYPSMIRGLEELAFHTRELQESVMAIRMQPVKSVFARMPRLVRELSAKLDKKVDLITSGEDTEVDKTVIEEISDPITHMLRNALDHGLEPTEDRIAAGKPAQGTIRLSAEHRSGRIVIAIRDDGAGINREKVLAKAVANGVVAAGAKLADEEIDNLIFAPGFSTAEEVTDVSGRGVGMDVVRRNIQALGGRVSILNRPGQGTEFTMTLPLTLAVMDGMITAAGGEKYVIPITNIVESLRPDASDVRVLPGGSRVVSVRGEQLGLVSLKQAFNLHTAIDDPSKALVVLVDTETRGRIGIVVDELLGQQQVVIKSLEANYDPVGGISGATILGNGRVAPILDVESLTTLVGKQRRNGQRDDAQTSVPEAAAA